MKFEFEIGTNGKKILERFEKELFQKVSETFKKRSEYLDYFHISEHTLTKKLRRYGLFDKETRSGEIRRILPWLDQFETFDDCSKSSYYIMAESKIKAEIRKIFEKKESELYRSTNICASDDN